MPPESSRQAQKLLLSLIGEVCAFLAARKIMFHSKEKIYNYVWNGEYLQDDSNITSHVRRLRKKIENDPSQPEYIQTVRGVGYKINSLKRE